MRTLSSRSYDELPSRYPRGSPFRCLCAGISYFCPTILWRGPVFSKMEPFLPCLVHEATFMGSIGRNLRRYRCAVLLISDFGSCRARTGRVQDGSTGGSMRPLLYTYIGYGQISFGLVAGWSKRDCGMRPCFATAGRRRLSRLRPAVPLPSCGRFTEGREFPVSGFTRPFMAGRT